jgi:sulfofructose kinase
VSTLGAGDVFHGALLAQVIQGYKLADALQRANAVAALSCLGLDGQSMIPNTSELNSFLKERS